MKFTGEPRNKGTGLEMSASHTFYHTKLSKIEVKFNLIDLIRDKEDKADL